MSKRIPLVGEELAAYEEEQNRKRKEEALKASLIKEEESKATLGAELATGDPMVIDTNIKQPSLNGIRNLFIVLAKYMYFLDICHYKRKESVLVDLNLTNSDSSKKLMQNTVIHIIYLNLLPTFIR